MGDADSERAHSELMKLLHNKDGEIAPRLEGARALAGLADGGADLSGKIMLIIDAASSDEIPEVREAAARAVGSALCSQNESTRKSAAAHFSFWLFFEVSKTGFDAPSKEKLSASLGALEHAVSRGADVSFALKELGTFASGICDGKLPFGEYGSEATRAFSIIGACLHIPSSQEAANGLLSELSPRLKNHSRGGAPNPAGQAFEEHALLFPLRTSESQIGRSHALGLLMGRYPSGSRKLSYLARAILKTMDVPESGYRDSFLDPAAREIADQLDALASGSIGAPSGHPRLILEKMPATSDVAVLQEVLEIAREREEGDGDTPNPCDINVTVIHRCTERIMELLPLPELLEQLEPQGLAHSHQDFMHSNFAFARVLEIIAEITCDSSGAEGETGAGDLAALRTISQKLDSFRPAATSAHHALSQANLRLARAACGKALEGFPDTGTDKKGVKPPRSGAGPGGRVAPKLPLKN